MCYFNRYYLSYELFSALEMYKGVSFGASRKHPFVLSIYFLDKDIFNGAHHCLAYSFHTGVYMLKQVQGGKKFMVNTAK